MNFQPALVLRQIWPRPWILNLGSRPVGRAGAGTNAYLVLYSRTVPGRCKAKAPSG